MSARIYTQEELDEQLDALLAERAAQGLPLDGIDDERALMPLVRLQRRESEPPEDLNAACVELLATND